MAIKIDQYHRFFDSVGSRSGITEYMDKSLFFWKELDPTKPVTKDLGARVQKVWVPGMVLSGDMQSVRFISGSFGRIQPIVFDDVEFQIKSFKYFSDLTQRTTETILTYKGATYWGHPLVKIPAGTPRIFVAYKPPDEYFKTFLMDENPVLLQLIMDNLEIVQIK